MEAELSSEERLQILRAVDKERQWYTVDDKRLCFICERVISGRQIKIVGGPTDYALACPTQDCPGNFHHWFLYGPMAGSPKTPATDSGDDAGEIDFISDFAQPGAPGL